MSRPQASQGRHSFGRSLFTVSGLTILSRVGGFVRDTLTAMFLGAGPVADAFFVAQRLPNLFRSLFAEGAFSAAFVPLYTTEQQRNGSEAAQEFAGEALAMLLAILIPFSAVLMFFMPYVMRVLAPGFEEDPVKYDLAVKFSLITFPYLTLISITALQSGVLNARGRFGPGAAAPIALNIVLIAGLFIAHFLHLDVGYTLAWALTVSGLVQMLWLALSCWRAGVSIPLMWPHLTAASRRLFRRVGPGSVGAGAAQINLLISTSLASRLATGAVSWLFYADRLNQLPLGIVGIAVATTLLPRLSRHVEAGEEEDVRHFTSRAIEFCLLLGLPATVGLGIAARPIIQTLFEHGAFSPMDTTATAEALGAYALGIPAFLLVKVFASSFFARHDTATPVKIAFIAMTVNVLGSVLMLGPLQHIGIALANSLAVWVNAILLYAKLRPMRGAIGDTRLRRTAPRLILSALVMSAVTFALMRGLEGFFMGQHFAKQIIGLGLIIGFSSLAYGLMLQLTSAMRLSDVRKILESRGSKSPKATEAAKTAEAIEDMDRAP
ncbi:MAG: murein biosynthesis integral membrane protein MurJ [Pseudomonadota bacterium]|nr:murein biosynthesis integral membrane protein MurJ [Pseudomonadota bacterium]